MRAKCMDVSGTVSNTKEVVNANPKISKTMMIAKADLMNDTPLRD